MPCEAYPAVYWQYFAVHFIVQGREQMRVLKDSTVCPREAATSFPLKGATWPATEEGQGKGEGPHLGIHIRNERRFGEKNSGTVAYEKINQKPQSLGTHISHCTQPV